MRRRTATLAAAAAVVIQAAAGCVHRPPPAIPTAPPGRSVAIFMSADPPPPPELARAEQVIRDRIRQAGGEPPPPAGPDALAYVDDRRWIDLPADGDLVLPELAPGADLDSLVVEPLGAPGALALVRCARAPSFAGVVGGARRGRGGGGGPAQALLGRSVEIGLDGGGTVAGIVRSVDDAGFWLDDGGRRVRVERRIVPVSEDPERRTQVLEREMWRTTVFGNPGAAYAGESKSWVAA